MAIYIRHRRLAHDDWRALEGDPGRWLRPAEDGFVPELPRGDLIVPLEIWRVRARDLDDRNRRGVLLPAETDPEAIAGDLSRLDLIAIRIASPTDGRAYSTARLLRGRHGFRGELRAVGAVARDQLALLERCGVEAFELPDGADVASALAAFGEIGVSYQRDARIPPFAAVPA
jgi:uncharacterized protein (DUF934 family)